MPVQNDNFMATPLPQQDEPPTQRARTDSNVSGANRASGSSNSIVTNSASRSGHSSAEQYIENTTNRLIDAINGANQVTTVPPRDAEREAEREALQFQILKDEAATKKMQREMAELQLAKLRREMGIGPGGEFI